MQEASSLKAAPFVIIIIKTCVQFLARPHGSPFVIEGGGGWRT